MNPQEWLSAHCLERSFGNRSPKASTSASVGNGCLARESRRGGARSSSSWFRGLVRSEGALGPGGALVLSEFALGNQANARFTLRWKRDGDSITITGLWHESVECDRVRLAGTLPPRAQ